MILFLVEPPVPTCALLGAAWFLSVHPKFTAKVFLPELGKPHISAIVGQRPTLKVTVERCEKE